MQFASSSDYAIPIRVDFILYLLRIFIILVFRQVAVVDRDPKACPSEQVSHPFLLILHEGV